MWGFSRVVPGCEKGFVGSGYVAMKSCAGCLGRAQRGLQVSPLRSRYPNVMTKRPLQAWHRELKPRTLQELRPRYGALNAVWSLPPSHPPKQGYAHLTKLDFANARGLKIRKALPVPHVPWPLLVANTTIHSHHAPKTQVNKADPDRPKARTRLHI